MSGSASLNIAYDGLFKGLHCLLINELFKLKLSAKTFTRGFFFTFRSGHVSFSFVMLKLQFKICYVATDYVTALTAVIKLYS